jgi:four helix bundle protein
MRNKIFARQLEERTKKFSIYIIRYSISLSNTLELNIIRKQVVKSATSIGANYREANRSRSKADFVGRLRICQSEASETIYWLEILQNIATNNPPSNELLKESNELLALFTAIITKLRSKPN